MNDLIRIGTQFTYNGKLWRITGFSSEKVFFRSLVGNLQSQVDHDMFLQVAESIQPPANKESHRVGTENS